MNEAFKQAVKLLARREHSYHELKQKLASKGFVADDIENELAKCQQQGYQSDDRFVEQFCRYRVGHGDGPLKIRHALQQKGISNDLADQYLNRLDWNEHALVVYRKKFADTGSDFKDFKTRQKQMRFMQGRGFDAELIKACFASLEDYY